MPEQFDRISDFARQAAVLPDAASVRARGAGRQRRRLVAQSTGGVGAVMGVAALIVAVSGGSTPRTVAAGDGLPPGTAYVCPDSGDPAISFLIKSVPSGDGKGFVLPSGCKTVTEPADTDPVDTSAPPSPGDWENPVPIPSGTAWIQVTSTSKLPAGATLTLVEQTGDFFLDVHEAGAKQDVIYILGYDGPVQVVPLLRELGFKHLTEQVATGVCQFIDSVPHAVMDIRGADGHSVLGTHVSADTPLSFFEAPDATAFPSGAEDGLSTASAVCASASAHGN